MTAAGLTAADWVYSEYRGMLIREVRIAIIDGSNETGNATDGVFPLSALDYLLHTEGAGEAMERLRAIFARTVQEELEAQCRALVRQLGQNAASRDGGHGLAAPFPDEGAARDPGEDHQRHGDGSAACSAPDRDAGGASERDAIGGPDPDLSPLRIPVVKVGLARPAIH